MRKTSRDPKVVRSRLKLKEHKGYWVAVGQVPYKLPDGSIGYRRAERGIGSSCRTKAEKEAYVESLNRAYEDQASAHDLTFQRALSNYVSTGHPEPAFSEQMLALFGARQCFEITDTIMVDAREKMFPPEAKPSYVNRHLYTPVIAILNMAAKGQTWKPELTRPKGHKKSPPLVIPKSEWFRHVVPYLSASRRALVAFLAVHGRRLGDALRRNVVDYDRRSRTLFIGEDKNGLPVLIELLPQVATLIDAMLDEAEKQHQSKRRAKETAGEDPDTIEPRGWLFGDGPTSASNVRRDIMVACARASGHSVSEAWKITKKPAEHRAVIKKFTVPYFGPHALGRHFFATRLLRAGYSLKHLQEAGGWATIEMPAQRYLHLEKKEVNETVHKLGHEFAEQQLSAGKMREEKPQRAKKPVNIGENDDA